MNGRSQPISSRQIRSPKHAVPDQNPQTLTAKTAQISPLKVRIVRESEWSLWKWSLIFVLVAILERDGTFIMSKSLQIWKKSAPFDRKSTAAACCQSAVSQKVTEIAFIYNTPYPGTPYGFNMFNYADCYIKLAFHDNILATPCQSICVYDLVCFI